MATYNGPIPKDLAGFQLLHNSKIEQGDLLIPEDALSPEDWMWASGGAIGSTTTGEGRFFCNRVYRRIPVPKAGDHDKNPTTGRTYLEERAASDHKLSENVAGMTVGPLAITSPNFTISKGSIELKDSGERRSFGTGSVRDMATGKGCPHLMPLRAFMLGAVQMERGKQKYGARNWELGQPLSSYFDSGFRHLAKHWLGYTDEPHLDAFVWNAMCYAETAERIRLGILPKELDDRPTIGKATNGEQGFPEKSAV